MATALENLPGQTSPDENGPSNPTQIAQAANPQPVPVATPPVALTAKSVTPAVANPSLQGVDGDLASRVNALINAAHGRVNVQSGFRTLAQQTDLYRREPNLAAPPGHSNHEKGLAVDLGGDYALIAQLAPQFGLVLPMSWEPWHVELPGQHAGSSPQAYTQSPYGDPNPTVDPNLTSSPQHVFATAVSAMKELTGLGQVTSLGEQTGAGSMDGATTSAVGTRTSTTPDQFTAPSAGEALAPSASRDAFIQEILPYAEAESKRTGIPPEVFIVQSGLETGWGTSGWWRNNKNPAGIGVTGAPGAGNTYADLGSAFHDYADKLLGHGEAGQEQFAAAVKQGASPEQLLSLLQQSPWAAGQYGGNGLTNTYQQLYGSGRQAPPPAPKPAAPTYTAAPSQAR